MSYQFWNDFVDNWRSLPPNLFTNPTTLLPNNSINGWTNPNLLPLLNTYNATNDYSLKYLPEPWWGNDGSGVLNAVVINYNPWHGNANQEYQNSKGLYNSLNYQAFVQNHVNLSGISLFKGTNDWHYKKRAKIIFDTLSNIGVNVGVNNQLNNHLSIELIPWHTNDIRHIGQYIYNNLLHIYNNCIVFAANEAGKIQNSKLKNKVLIRISGRKIIGLLERFEKNNICQYSPHIPNNLPTGTTIKGRSNCFKFAIDNLPNTEFICIWGRYSRNDFPPTSDMICIFKKVI